MKNLKIMTTTILALTVLSGTPLFAKTNQDNINFHELIESGMVEHKNINKEWELSLEKSAISKEEKEVAVIIKNELNAKRKFKQIVQKRSRKNSKGF